MTRRDSGHQVTRKPPAGLPVVPSGEITPAGELEQSRKFASALARQAGWRRTAARVAAVMVLLLIIGAIVAGFLASR
jgi:hypothetical protein